MVDAGGETNSGEVWYARDSDGDVDGERGVKQRREAAKQVRNELTLPCAMIHGEREDLILRCNAGRT